MQSVLDRVHARAAEAQNSKRKDWERLQVEAPELCGFAKELSKAIGAKVSIVYEGRRYGEAPKEKVVERKQGLSLLDLKTVCDERFARALDAFNASFVKRET